MTDVSLAVALESSLIAQGLPRPANLRVALRLEAAVRSAGAVPATVALLDGVARIGLDPALLERVAREGLAKAGLADLPIFAARRMSAGTTVSATAHLAWRAGLNVFATGGIGGVHRGDGWDVSADLPALGRIPVVLVCAGAKSVLDLAATFEVLETQGVTVVGWRTDRLPAFYVRDAGQPVTPVRDAAEGAAIYLARRRLGMEGAVVVCNPPPANLALDPEEHERWLAEAVAEAERRGVRGKEVTPFLLAELARASGGRTVEANAALVEGNARVAATIAVELAGV